MHLSACSRFILVAACAICGLSTTTTADECYYAINWNYTWGLGCSGCTCHHNCTVPIGSCFSGCGTTRHCDVQHVKSDCVIGKLEWDSNNQLVCNGNYGSEKIGGTQGQGSGQCPCEP